MGRLPVHLALFPGALASGPADSEVPIKRKVCVLGGGREGCQSREAPHRKVRGQGSAFGKQIPEPPLRPLWNSEVKGLLISL